MRIMHVSTRLILGGSQENTVLSCEGQADHGHDVSLVYGPIYGPEGSLLDRVRAHGGIELIETPDLVRQLSPVRDWRCERALRRIIREWRPDVVHTHSSKAGVLGRMAAWAENVPCVVHTIHGLPFHPYQAKWRNAIYIAAERFAAKRCHAIVTVADAMRDQALAVGVGRREQYRTVYSGMEVETFLDPDVSRKAMRDRLGLDDDDFVVGTLARLAELKGHDDLLDALAPLLAEHPRLHLLWVGDGWWRPRLEQRIKALGLAPRIHLAGMITPAEIPSHLQAMDVLVHASYREGLPRAVTQSLLSGVPVIAYDVDGAPEVCLEGKTGRLVRVGDLAGLRDAVAWMMGHPDEAEAMGRRGRELCRERFAASVMVEQLESLYAALLGANAGPDHAHRDRGDHAGTESDRPGS